MAKRPVSRAATAQLNSTSNFLDARDALVNEARAGLEASTKKVLEGMKLLNESLNKLLLVEGKSSEEMLTYARYLERMSVETSVLTDKLTSINS